MAPGAGINDEPLAGFWGDESGGNTVFWSEADSPAKLGELVASVADSGILLMVSRSQDGGALMVAFMDNGETKRRWFHKVDDAVAALGELSRMVDQRPATPSPSRRAGTSPSGRKRR